MLVSSAATGDCCTGSLAMRACNAMLAIFSSMGNGADAVATGIMPILMYKYPPITGINKPTIRPKINLFKLFLLGLERVNELRCDVRNLQEPETQAKHDPVK